MSDAMKRRRPCHLDLRGRAGAGVVRPASSHPTADRNERAVNARPLNVAVIGAGPAGIYASDILSKSGMEVCIDLFEQLPAPSIPPLTETKEQ